MQEIIGNITLDYTYYPGEDLYSDGAVEDELLKIAMENREQEFNRVIAEKKSWPVMYHFSHIRTNIVEWLPLKKSDSVLEIGSGCGAITGVLARKAGEVRCIELSKKRSYINAYRNREYDNIRIDVGNFQDIEKNMKETYDFITLIGVFEYAQGYIGGENPYVEMLEKISKHLNPGGKIIIAIENRLGLKYWAGCREDHAGLWFEGLEGYHDTEGVRTFSKKELQKIIRSAGEFETEFYYPYPDYKFPMTIFSDERLPLAGELNQNIVNFDRDRLQVFDETKVFDTLLDSEMFPEFSNSFLTILTVPGSAPVREQIVYTKYSNERANARSIRTDMIKDRTGGYSIRKNPWKASAAGHIETLLQAEKVLRETYKNTRLEINRCESWGQGVKFEFIRGKTLEEDIDELIRRGELEKAKEVFLQYLQLIKNSGEKGEFQITEDFCRVFGKPEGDALTGLPCLKTTDIDMVLPNILIREESWNLIDYEWTFDFPIPVNYVLFRVIHYYMETGGRNTWVELKDWDLYEEIGIEEKEIHQYLIMEKAFQRWIEADHIPIRELYDDISPGIMNVYKLAKAEEKRRFSEQLQVFLAGEEDFSEENSVYYPMKNGEIQITLSIPAHVKKLRLDPCSYAGLLTMEKFVFNKSEEKIAFISNGFQIDEKRVAFSTMDPQLFIMDIPEGCTELAIEFRMDPASQQVGNYLGELQQIPQRQKEEIAALKTELARKENLIREMENTKVWKAYRKLKNMSGKGE